MGEFSLIHWLIVVGILLLLFGPSKLPQLGSSLGQGIKNFKKAFKDSDTPSIDDKKPEKDPEKRS
ncbi:MAG: Twin-arginine translocation protein TatA [Bacteriovoracaceae bacterium]|nr:Twin-arginine translocation protein TatA [Bacteriovoracaceae bacterium]